MQSSPLAFAGSADPRIFPVLPQAAPRLPGRRRRGRFWRRTFEQAIASRFFGTCLVVVFLTGAAGYGAVRGGAYGAFVAANGTIPDVVAKFCGFPIKAVTIAGTHELRDREVLKVAGIGPQNSLAFLNVDAVRKRLMALPLIKDVSVSKLFPNRLLIEIDERTPYALWQQNGVVAIVAADGTPIDDMRDAKFERLPLVVGEDANKKIADYLDILEGAGELRKRVRAGIYVGQRRWSLKMDNGVEIELPEIGAPAAIARFAQFERDGHVLEKDIISADLRIPGRVVTRLTEEAAEARLAALTAKTKKKGAGI